MWERLKIEKNVTLLCTLNFCALATEKEKRS